MYNLYFIANLMFSGLKWLSNEINNNKKKFTRLLWC